MIDQIEAAEATDRLSQFTAKFAGLNIQSTSAAVVDYSGDLYNVNGSTPDPKIDGKTWKRLLQFHGISGACFADTPAAPPGSSHPAFSVGGHVTPNASGDVPTGSSCYLMPLCYWHNGKGNDGKVFHHAQTRMLELFGYMQGEPAATYLARMGGAAPMSLVYVKQGGLSYRQIAAPSASPADMLRQAVGEDEEIPGRFVLLARQGEGSGATYTIAESELSGT
jgi:hypothetical protein